MDNTDNNKVSPNECLPHKSLFIVDWFLCWPTGECIHMRLNGPRIILDSAGLCWLLVSCHFIALLFFIFNYIDLFTSLKILRGTDVYSFHLTAIEIKKIGTGEKSDRNTKSVPTSSLVSGVVFTRSWGRVTLTPVNSLVRGPLIITNIYTLSTV